MDRELEEIYSKSQKLYWNDPEFHARCQIAFKFHREFYKREPTSQEFEIMIHSAYFGRMASLP